MRKSKKENLALVLSGGGARGMAHIGVLKVLEKNNIVPNVIIGTSAGAMVGGFYCAGKLPEFEEALLNKKLKDIKKMIPFLPTGDGLIRTTRLEKEFRGIIEKQKIEDLKKKFISIAVDILSGKKVCLTEGDLCEAIEASIAIPLLFTPIKKDSMILVDGGLEDPLPVDEGFRHAKKVIAVSIERPIDKMPKKEKYGFADIAERVLSILQSEIVETALKKYRKNLVVIRPEVNIDTLEFHRAKEAIEIGESEAKKQIEEVKKLVLSI